jgi:hypothetical protein
MTVIGFNFSRINVERTGSKKGKITISNNVSISEVSELKIPLGGDKAKCVKFDFKFDSKYEPSVATISLAGDLLYLLPNAEADKIITEWKKNKKLTKEALGPVMNAILSKCNVEALILSKELNLPSPIPLPKVNVKQ